MQGTQLGVMSEPIFEEGTVSAWHDDEHCSAYVTRSPVIVMNQRNCAQETLRGKRKRARRKVWETDRSS